LAEGLAQLGGGAKSAPSLPRLPPKLRKEPYGSSRATLPRKRRRPTKFLFCFPTLSPKTALMFKPISR